MLSLCAILFLLEALATLASGLYIPIQRRSHFYFSSGSPGANPYGIKNHGNMGYTGTVSVNGHPFEVHLDTGSSDLWFNMENVTVAGLKPTNIPASVEHEDGSSSSGSVIIGNVTWGGYAVHNQAFISASTANHSSTPYQGLLGLGPPSKSDVTRVMANHPEYDGTTFLNNIFKLDSSEPNLITFLLSRNVAGVADGGIFTIGEIVSGLRKIIQSPRLHVATDNMWSTFMDSVVVNGKVIEGGTSSYSSVPSAGNETLVVFDTGIPNVRAPPSYVDAIYSGLPGAQFNGKDGYIVPCHSKVNVSLVFSGTYYPVHPIDTVAPQGFDEHGNVKCVGMFTYLPKGVGVDFILGDTFLRNVYSLFDFGTWTNGVTSPPYMQLLSIVKPDKAWSEFDTLNSERIKQLMDSRHSPNTPPIRTSSVTVQNNVITAPSATPSAKTKNTQKDWSFWLVFGLLGLLVLLFVFLAVDRLYRHIQGYKTIEEQQQGGNNMRQYSDRA